MIVAIDGPAGRQEHRRAEARRAPGISLPRHGRDVPGPDLARPRARADLDDADALTQLAAGNPVTFTVGLYRSTGETSPSAIRSRASTASFPRRAAPAAARGPAGAPARARRRGERRDRGPRHRRVVCPDADVKVFLVADEAERARAAHRGAARARRRALATDLRLRDERTRAASRRRTTRSRSTRPTSRSTRS